VCLAAFQTALMYGKAPSPKGRFSGGSFTTWWASGVWATPARLRATGCPYGARRVECGQPRNRRSRLSTPLWCGQLGCPHGRGAAIAVCLGCSAFWAFFFSSPQGPPEAPPVGPCTHGLTPAAMFQTMSAGRSAQAWLSWLWPSCRVSVPNFVSYRCLDVHLLMNSAGLVANISCLREA
jgi:hypothetical protein